MLHSIYLQNVMIFKLKGNGGFMALRGKDEYFGVHLTVVFTQPQKQVLYKVKSKEGRTSDNKSSM